MSSYGPPGGPYPRQPDPYGDPADPWGGQDPWGGPPTSPPPTSPPGYDDPRFGQPTYQQPRYDQGYPADSPGYRAPGYDWDPGAAPPPRPRSGRRSTVIILTIVVLVLLVGVGTFTAFLLTGGKDKQNGGPTAAAGPTGDTTAGQTSNATTGPTAGPSGSGGDGRSVTVGQCVVNDGTDSNPSLRVVPCAPGTYEVLKRFDGTVDYKTKCATVPGYQFHYFYDSQLDGLDFVLCMRKR